MYKTKLINKSYEHREDRARLEREERRDRTAFGSDSEEQSSGELQQLDFNNFCSSEEQSFSIESFIENLQAQKVSYLQQQSVDEEQQDSSDGYYSTSCSSLQRINAQYMQMMSNSPPVAPKGGHIRFDPSVRVKFFNDSLPVCELSMSQQYSFESDQYQQTAEEGLCL